LPLRLAEKVDCFPAALPEENIINENMVQVKSNITPVPEKNAKVPPYSGIPHAVLMKNAAAVRGTPVRTAAFRLVLPPSG
jgi:hypothetical protein